MAALAARGLPGFAAQGLVPAIGIGCEKAGHIFVERRNPKQAAQAITTALNRLGDGIGLLFFPEGTRSRDGHLLPFKKGAFRTAIDQQRFVVGAQILGFGTPRPKPATAGWIDRRWHLCHQ